MNWNERLAPYVEKKLVKKVDHPSLPLSLYTYTQEAQIQRAWDAVTMIARGLVVDIDGNIVGRGFDKMFNVQELPHELKPPFTAREKVDGSLIHIFRYRGRVIVHSKGSFTSDVALAAEYWLYRQSGGPWWVREGYTYVCEWVSPDNRIVVDYKDREELVILGIRDMQNNTMFHPEGEVPLTSCKYYGSYLDLDMVIDHIPVGTEGFILEDSEGRLAKIKSAWYVELHRAVFHLTSDTIWQMCKSATLMEYMQFLLSLDNEAEQWARTMARIVAEKFFQTHAYVHDLYVTSPRHGDRKTFAEWAKKQGKYSSILFLLHSHEGEDTERSNELIWKLVRPEKLLYRFQPKEDADDNV